MPQQIPDEILYDVRLQARYIARGLLTQEALDKRLEDLQDAAPQVSAIDLDRLAPAGERSAPAHKV